MLFVGVWLYYRWFADYGASTFSLVWDGSRIVGINASQLTTGSRYYDFVFALKDGANNESVYSVTMTGNANVNTRTVAAPVLVSSSSAVASDPTGQHGAVRTWVQLTSTADTTAAGSWTAADLLDFGRTTAPPAAAAADNIAAPSVAWDTSVVSRGYPRLRRVLGQ